MSFVSDLDPQPLWRHFDRLLSIPRASKKEERAREYVLEVAERNGLEARVDSAGNVVVRKPASAGYEEAAPTILQSHLDMVQEKNSDVEHDFEHEPIEPALEGEYLTASGTTLGADNGVGVAAMLALAEDREAAHGPLELLFTVDEETGLTGAAGLAADLLDGRRLLNLDSEEEGVLTIGCAGGADTELRLQASRERAPEGSAAFAIHISGLRGGHSGVDIHLQRANAIRILSRAAYAALERHSLHLGSIGGGNAHNAIPREARAVIVAPTEERDSLREDLEAELRTAAEEVASVDPDLRWEIEETDVPGKVWSLADSERALALLNALPHGVMRMSDDIPGLVETSTNLAVVREQGDGVHVLMSSRSSVMTALAHLRRRIRAIGKLAECEVHEEEGYPGWKPDVRSPLLAVVSSVYERVAGKPEIGAIHAGLECGIIGEKYPGMDMVSLGPQIEYPHSPDERVKIDSVATFYRILLETLEELAKSG